MKKWLFKSKLISLLPSLLSFKVAISRSEFSSATESRTQCLNSLEEDSLVAFFSKDKKLGKKKNPIGKLR